MNAHESPTGSQLSSGDGETTTEEGAETHSESESQEVPMSLSDLLGWVDLHCCTKKCRDNFFNFRFQW